MSRSQQWVLASSNLGKCQEINQILKNSSFKYELISQSEFNLPDTPETGLTFIENALIKARAASAATQLPALADDSGLVVEGLSGQPGLYSARFAGPNPTSPENIQKLVQQLTDNPTVSRQAYFYCVMVLLLHETHPSPIIGIGRFAGEIILTPRGNNGFGYDPVFYLPKYQKTLAELAPHIKNQISHRAQALQDLMRQVSDLF